MTFKYVAFTRGTANKNPFMIKREYENLIREKEIYIQGLEKDYEKVKIAIVIPNETEQDTKDVLSSQSKFIIKLSDLKIAKVSTKNYSTDDSCYNYMQGKSAICFIEEANEAIEKKIKEESVRLEAIKEEKIRFINKYLTKWD